MGKYFIQCNKGAVLKFLNLLKMLRLKDWFYTVGIAFLGYFYKIDFDIHHFLYLTVIASLYVGHGYIINNYFDMKKEDSNCIFNLSPILIISLFFLFTNLIISFFYSKLIFLLVILGAIISFLYSSSYTSLKDIPLFNIILNSTGFTILFLIGYFSNKNFTLDVLHLSGYIWLGIIPSQIIHLMAHKTKEKNWPFSLGISLKQFYLSQLVWLGWAFVVFSFLNHIYILFVLTLMFCIIQVVTIELYRRKGYIDTGNFFKIRNKFKFLNIIFGMALMALIIYH